MRKISIITALMLVLGTEAYANGGGVCSVWDPTWRDQHGDSERNLLGKVDDYSSQLTNANRETYEQITSSIAALTSQRARTDNQIATADRKATEAGASAITTNMTRLAIARAEETYGPQGQPPNACEVAEQLSELSRAVAYRRDTAEGQVTDEAIDTRAGGVADVDEVMARWRRDASENTLDVRKSLLDPNADKKSKDAFINFLAGLPLQKTELEDGGASAGAGNIEDYHQNRIAARMEAFRSPALYSLGAIKGLDSSDEGQSVAEQMDWLMSRYGGGPAHEAWAAAMATKSEPGIVKEIARMRSITMTIRRMNNEADERMTVMMATMLGQEAGR